MKKYPLFTLFAVTLLFSTKGFSALKDVHCPSEISSEQIQQLSQKKELTIDGTAFKLDGSSKTALQSISYQDFQRFSLSYDRVEERRIACWYQTDSGFVGIRQK